jgi:hypothetical protein
MDQREDSQIILRQTGGANAFSLRPSEKNRGDTGFPSDIIDNWICPV